MTKEREFTRRRWIQAATAAAGATALSGCIGDGGDGGSGGQSWRNEELAAVPAEEYDSLYEPGDD
jgi:spermidine/putrescine transport system substrate-binding protein